MRLLWVAAVLLPLAAYAQQTPSNAADGGAKPTDPYVEIVKRVQERLHVHGYDIGRIDGALDERTQRAIAQFQLSQALPAGGSIDDDTMRALGVDMAEVQMLRAEAASPPRAGAGSSASVGETAQPK